MKLKLPATSSFRSNIFLCTLFFSDASNQYFLFMMKDQASHPYETTGRIAVSNLVVPTALSLRAKRQEREAENLTLSNAKAKNWWTYTFSPTHVCSVWCLVKYLLLLSGSRVASHTPEVS
jgi:hypothetical protein